LIFPDADLIKQHRLNRILAIGMMVVFPIVYLVVGFTKAGDNMTLQGASDIVFYMLLFMAIVTPMLAPFISRVQIANVKKTPDSKVKPAGLYMTVSLVKFALVEACYIFGLVVCLVTGSFGRMLVFYMIGAFWTAIYWPRESQIQSFLEKLEKK